ncbi:hypothetical protein LTR09_000210 [Extremus antarcticus]|uniref:Uncharacterized protein n=1 Tax=Extremus antarcticus TaxID=702011 RepID=A0AAJ0GJ70_9PEZI|nr:hypothetical protein LTR09_000210 [Extremus antarcticus]
MRRSSQAQPPHRRAFWAQSAVGYSSYIKNHDPGLRDRNSSDHGMDNFSYDSAHVDKNQMPTHTNSSTPSKLSQAFDDFQLSEAAIKTSIARIEELNNDAPRRTNPRSSHHHLLSRRPSDQSPTSTGAESTTASFGSSWSPITPVTMTPIPENTHAVNTYKLPVYNAKPHVPVDMRGLESPPFTPLDSRALNTPLHPPTFSPKSTAPDLALVTAQLSPLSIRRQLSITSPPTRASNELAWESYLKTLDEEIWDLRHNALMRLQGFRDIIKFEVARMLYDGRIKQDETVKLEKWLIGKMSHYQEMVDTMEKKIQATSCVLGTTPV